MPPIAIGSLGFFQAMGVNRPIDPTYKKKLDAAGYQIGSLEYQDVTEQSIRPFNILVLQWLPDEGKTAQNVILDQKLPILESYVRNGGGLLITVENVYRADKAINRLLKPFAAELVNEDIEDSQHTFQQPKYLRWSFATTTNLNRASPLTVGFASFTYPLGGSHAQPLRLSPDWQPAISGEASAHSSGGTFAQAPVLVASRTYGKGRIVLMGMHTTFFFNAGYHRIWEGLCMEQGNGYQLLDNCYHWLAQPTQQANGLGGYHEPPAQGPPPAPSSANNPTDIYTQLVRASGLAPIKQLTHHAEALNDYTGLIGAHSDYSDGHGSVGEYVAKAKAHGYSFIVFTESLPEMNEAKWQQLAADCKAASDANFIAIPGLSYLDPPGNHLICFNLPRWPNKEWLTADGKRVQDAPGLYFGLDWVPVYVMQPAHSPTRPWYQKFYTGLELCSYLHGQTTPTEAMADYLQLQANVYNLVPIAGHELYAPDEISAVTGYQTHAAARQISDVPLCFKYTAYEQRRAYVSDGPRINEWAMANGFNSMPMGHGAQIIRESPWQLALDVSSDAPLTDVILYDQKRVFYHFRPGQRHFQQVLRGYHDQQRFITMEVRDAQGHRAISSCRYTDDVRHVTFMCGDQQNTLNNMAFVDNEGKLNFCAAMGYYVTGWDSLGIGILAPTDDMFPSGLDYIAGGFGGGLSHTIYGEKANEGGTVAQRDIVFGSGDVNIMDNHFDTHLAGPGGMYNAPNDLATSTVRIISFTPCLYSYNLMLLEHTTRFKKDVALAKHPGPELARVHIGGSDKSFANYSYIAADGHKVSGPHPKDTLAATLPPGGYVALWPDFYGAAAVYPLSQRNASFSLNGTSFEVGDELPGQHIAAGTVIKNSYLVARGKFGEDTEAGFDRLRHLYGLDGAPAYALKLAQGEVLQAALFPALQANRYTVMGKVSPAPLPNELGVSVAGLNANWDAGVYDQDQRVLRRMGVFENKGYFTANISAGLNFVAGNLLIADNEQVRLHLFATDGQMAQIEAHNPTANPMTVRLRGNPRIRLLARISQTVRLQPGESKILDARLGSPVQWSEVGLKVGR